MHVSWKFIFGTSILVGASIASYISHHPVRVTTVTTDIQVADLDPPPTTQASSDIVILTAEQLEPAVNAEVAAAASLEKVSPPGTAHDWAETVSKSESLSQHERELSKILDCNGRDHALCMSLMMSIDSGFALLPEDAQSFADYSMDQEKKNLKQTIETLENLIHQQSFPSENIRLALIRHLVNLQRNQGLWAESENYVKLLPKTDSVESTNDQPTEGDS